MELLWPGALLLLGLIPLVIAAYVWMLRRRKRFAIRYSSLALIREALPHQSRLRRHLPFALFLLGLASLVMASSRPVATVTVPSGQSTIILAMDISLSMCSTDIQPNRLESAKEAALSYVERQTSTSQIGIVAFAGFAELIQPPTSDREELQNAIESLTTARRTAIGSAILESLDAIAEINTDVSPSSSDPSDEVLPETGAPGEYIPDIVVLLTDGASNSGILPMDAAQQAVQRGIRVYTIGFGTDIGAEMNCGDQILGDSFFGGGQSFGGFPFGGGFRRGIDEPTLIQIAEMTGGTYYAASSAGELQEVFQELPTYLITKEETTEISVVFAAIGTLMAALALIFSFLWHPLP